MPETSNHQPLFTESKYKDNDSENGLVVNASLKNYCSKCGYKEALVLFPQCYDHNKVPVW